MTAAYPCVDCEASRSVGLKQCFGCWKAAPAARPTGVPLTADNVVDAVECRAANGDTWKYRGGAVWECGASVVDMMTLVFFAEKWGTVVTKWRK